MTESVTLYVGYSYTQGVPGAGGTAQFARLTNLATEIVPAIGALYRRIVNPAYVVRRIGMSCNNVATDTGMVQLNMFEDASKQLRGMALQKALLDIRAKYGKNSILKGMNYMEGATNRERNNQIGGHRSGTG